MPSGDRADGEGLKGREKPQSPLHRPSSRRVHAASKVLSGWSFETKASKQQNRQEAQRL